MFLKVVFFWFQGRGCPYKGTMPNVATNSKSLVSGLSNEVYNLAVRQLVQEILGKVRRTFVYRAGIF